MDALYILSFNPLLPPQSPHNLSPERSVVQTDFLAELGGLEQGVLSTNQVKHPPQTCRNMREV